MNTIIIVFNVISIFLIAKCHGAFSKDDKRLSGLDSNLIDLIRNEVLDSTSGVTWDDISGLEFAKKTIQEVAVWPLLRPDIFTGLRKSAKGVLLFGPPGNGKTLIGKCIAAQCNSTFFSISASSLLSKWLGESEKLVRTLFVVARCSQPAVIFIDEIDSLLKQRQAGEASWTRSMKTEFLVQLVEYLLYINIDTAARELLPPSILISAAFINCVLQDGASTPEDDRILVVAATNRPQDLDEAARRRFVRKIYIPLPEFEARRQIIKRLMSTEKNKLSEADLNKIARLTEGYSGADMRNLCQEASMEPIRSIAIEKMKTIQTKKIRPITLADFKSALKVIRSSVSSSDLDQFLEWDNTFGSRGTA